MRKKLQALRLVQEKQMQNEMKEDEELNVKLEKINMHSKRIEEKVVWKLKKRQWELWSTTEQYNSLNQHNKNMIQSMDMMKTYNIVSNYL